MGQSRPPTITRAVKKVGVMKPQVRFSRVPPEVGGTSTPPRLMIVGDTSLYCTKGLDTFSNAPVPKALPAISTWRGGHGEEGFRIEGWTCPRAQEQSPSEQ
jgi:hypothetical protein